MLINYNLLTRLMQTPSGSKWDKKRTYQMSLSFGLTSGFLCHFWYNYLDRWYPGKGLKVVCKKIVIDQFFFSPICIVSCLLVACSLNRHNFERTFKEVSYKGMYLYVLLLIVCISNELLSRSSIIYSRMFAVATSSIR